MIIDATFGLKGRYKAVVRGPDMEVRRESEWSDNVVTNLGVQMLLGGATVSPSATGVRLACSCGAGNSTPTVLDTQIQSFVAGTNTVQSFSTSRSYTTTPYYVMHTWTWRFGEGVAAGNISELCVANASGVPTSSSPVFSRALVRDSAGNPTTITIASDEYLDVTYEIYIYPSNDSSGAFSQTIDGVPTSFSYTMRPSNMSLTQAIGNTNGWAECSNIFIPTITPITATGQPRSAVYQTGGTLGSAGGQPTGTAFAIDSSSAATANYAMKYRDITYTAGLAYANTEFDCLRFAFNLGAWQMQISPSVNKVSTKTYTITIRVTLDNTI